MALKKCCVLPDNSNLQGELEKVRVQSGVENKLPELKKRCLMFFNVKNITKESNREKSRNCELERFFHTAASK